MNEYTKSAQLQLVSLAFAFFVALWFESASKSISTLVTLPTSYEALFETTIGILVFLLLVSLWWWYALILPAYSSTSLLTCSFDFVTLLVCAIGFKNWNNPKVFVFAYLSGSALVCIRLWHAYNRETAANVKRVLRIGGWAAAALVVACALTIITAMYAGDGSKDDFVSRVVVGCMSLSAICITAWCSNIHRSVKGRKRTATAQQVRKLRENVEAI